MYAGWTCVDYGQPVIVIPWVVLQELDFIKMYKKVSYDVMSVLNIIILLIISIIIIILNLSVKYIDFKLLL